MRSLVKLQHPGIPRVRDFFVVEQSVFIVMDFIEGLNLEDELALQPGNVLKACEAVQVAVEVLDVLAYMHSQSPPILHRDIKPANLIRESISRKIRVVDFGLARAHESQSPQTAVGTLGYCPPEQMMGQAVEASDLYAVGMTLYSLVTGVVPGLRTLIELKHSMPDYDEPLAAIIERATQPAVAERFGSARQMQSELRAWLMANARSSSEQTVQASSASSEPLSSSRTVAGPTPETSGRSTDLVATQRQKNVATSRLGLFALLLHRNPGFGFAGSTASHTCSKRIGRYGHAETSNGKSRDSGRRLGGTDLFFTH